MVKRIAYILLAVLIGFAIFAALRPRPLGVDAGVVVRGAVEASVEEEGKTRVAERYVVSAPVDGRVARIVLDEGRQVQRSDVLAEIDPLPLKSRISEAEAQIQGLKERMTGVEKKKPKPEELQRAQALEKVAEGALEVAKRELEEADALLAKAKQDTERARALARSGSGTGEELDGAVAEEAQAQARRSARDLNLRIRTLQISAAQLNTAILASRQQDFDWEKADYRQQIAAIEARLTSLRADLKLTVVRAPVGGKVLNLYEESQRAVAAGAPLLEIGDLKKLEIEAEFLSEDAAHMREGMHVEIYGRALGTKRLRGTVTRIYPSAFMKVSSLGVEQQRVKVVIGFDAAGTGLGDRFRVEVRVILDRRDDVLLVPEGALFRHGGKWHVFRVVDDTAKLTAVETGLRDGRVREVSGGLSEDDRVVLHPGADLKDGAAVAELR